MQVYAVASKQVRAGKNVSKALPTPNGWDIREIRSMSNPNKVYRVDVTNGRCNCPAWIFQSGGGRKPCKHLRSIGYVEIPQFAVQNIPVPAKVQTQKVKVHV